MAQAAFPVYMDCPTRKAVLENPRRRLLAESVDLASLPDSYVRVTNVANVAKPGVLERKDASRREKHRLTMIMRQAVTGMWDETKAEPTGHILDSVLLVPSVRHSRLEDMSHNEPSVWLREFSYEVDGKVQTYKKGQLVGPFLAPWRELRRQQPYLFYRRSDPKNPSSILPLEEWTPGPVRLWTQENATEGNSWLTELVAESGIN